VWARSIDDRRSLIYVGAAAQRQVDWYQKEKFSVDPPTDARPSWPGSRQILCRRFRIKELWQSNGGWRVLCFAKGQPVILSGTVYYHIRS